jgi:hypothetical protein
MLPILPILLKKMMFFAQMLSNSMKNASNRADLPFSPPRTIREPKRDLIVLWETYRPSLDPHPANAVTHR